MKDAVGIDGDDQFRAGGLEGVANGAGFAAVHGVAPDTDFYGGEVALGLEHPVVAVVDRAVVLRDDFKFVAWIIAVADALDGLVDRLALVEAGHEDAYRGLVAVVFSDRRRG